MIYFSQSKQSFYDLNLEYIELPDDLIEIKEEQHFDLLHKISSGHYVFSDLTSSEPKPSPYHEMNITKKKWEDNRTLEKTNRLFVYFKTFNTPTVQIGIVGKWPFRLNRSTN